MNDARALDEKARFAEAPYEVLGSLAAGRTSMLYLALAHAGTNGGTNAGAHPVANGAAHDARLVVLKRPQPGFMSDRRALAEFDREARFASAARSPNVVAVHAIGADTSGPFFAMDYVEGASLLRLQTLDREGRTLMTTVPTAVAVRVILDVLAGLHAIHEARDDGAPLNLVHGDLSPGNILVSVDGASLITDFGSTTHAGAPSTSSITGARPRPGYAAPEAILGEPVSRSTDIFAAGVMLWELFAGRRLFAAPTPQMIARQVVGGYIPELASVAPSVPRRVAAVCERALAREAHARFGSAEEFREELANAIGSSYGGVRHDAVAVFLRSRCAGMLAQVRRMIEHPDAAVQSGTRRRVTQP